MSRRNPTDVRKVGVITAKSGLASGLGLKIILTHRQAISMESSPPRLPWAPLEAADKREKCDDTGRGHLHTGTHRMS